MSLNLGKSKLEIKYDNYTFDILAFRSNADKAEKTVQTPRPAGNELLNQALLSQSFSYQVQQDTLFPHYSKPFDVSEVEYLPESPNVFDGADISFTVSLDKKVYMTNDVAVVSLVGEHPLQFFVNGRLISNQYPPTSLRLQLADYDSPITITVIDSMTSEEFTMDLDVLGTIKGELYIDPHPTYEHNHMAINYRFDTSEIGYFMVRALLKRDGIPVAILTSEQYASEHNDIVDDIFKVDATLLKNLDTGGHIWSLDNIFIEKLGGPLDEDKITLIEKRVELFGIESSALTIDEDMKMERHEARMNLIQPLLSE